MLLNSSIKKEYKIYGIYSGIRFQLSYRNFDVAEVLASHTNMLQSRPINFKIRRVGNKTERRNLHQFTIEAAHCVTRQEAAVSVLKVVVDFLQMSQQ